MKHTFKTYTFDLMRRLYEEPIDIIDYEDLYRELDFQDILNVNESWGDYCTLLGYEDGVNDRNKTL